METETIRHIREAVKKVEDSLKGFVLRGRKDEIYGNEGEYTAKTLKECIQGILGDIRVLTRSQSKFVLASARTEREQILNNLNGIGDWLDQQDYNQVANPLDDLKIIIRPYNVRGTKDSNEYIKDQANTLIGMYTELAGKIKEAQEIIQTAQKIRSVAEDTQNIMQSAQQKVDAVLGRADEVDNKSSEVDTILNQSKQSNANFEQLLISAKRHEKEIKDFSQHVVQRQQQLEDQQATTDAYKKKLSSYSNEREGLLNDAKELIEEARSALQYTTAAGISAAFTERYLEEVKKGWKARLWPFGAVISMVSGVAVATLPLYFEVNGWDIKLSMISMSAAFASAWFCAWQYVRYKNTLDDYGYKSVLAKSMIAFLDQFKEGEERKAYLETVLSEIHQDPLRKKHDVDTPASNILSKLRINRSGGQSDT